MKFCVKEIYLLIISQNMSTPTSQQYFKTLFPYLNFNWKLIYLVPLFQFRVSTTSFCSYCIQHDETVQYLFGTCNQVISLWTEIKLYFVNDIKLIALCPQIAILGYTNTDDKTQNLILLIFNFTYISQESVAT